MANEIDDDIKTLWDESETAHREAREGNFPWDEREDMFFGRYKAKGEDTKSVYSTGELTGMVLDSACRVMGQLATGRFEGIGDADIANVIAANLVYHEHVIPNDKRGGDYLTKNRQTNIYSKIYGTVPMFMDWIVSDTYTGPGSMVIHPRRFRPQPGKYVIEDMEYCFVEVGVTKRWLEEKAKMAPEVWKNIADVTEITQDSGSLTTEERKRAQNKKQIILRHYFDNEGNWKIFDAGSKVLIVDEKGYFPRIPIVDKLTIPVLDRYAGLCYFELGETHQKAIDALLRIHLGTAQYSMEPITIMDPEDVVMSSIIHQPKARWFVKNGKVDSIKQFNQSPQGLSVFMETYQILKANLLSLGAQTDTSVSKNVDPGFGKTPEAIKQQSRREGARDSWDRYMQERFIEKQADLALEMIQHKGLDTVKIENISKALAKIQKAYPSEKIDIFQNGVIRGEQMGKVGSLRYKADPGSTAKQDDSGEKIMGLLTSISENPKIEESMLRGGKRIDWGEAVKRVAIEDGITDWDTIVVDVQNPASVPEVGSKGGTIVSADGNGTMPTEPSMVPTGTVQPTVPQANVIQPQQ